MSENLAQLIIAEFQARSWTLATCESITGGLLGAAFTAVPGSSAVFRGGLITYASELKALLAGVDPQLIAERGVINGETARQMAQGAQQRCLAHWAIATTGVAGPGLADGMPVGTVWFAVAGPVNPTGQLILETQEQHFTGSRDEIRQGAVDYACDLLRRVALTTWE